jgi:iron-sulfur cluster repair protein YtfE (RIC family)
MTDSPTTLTPPAVPLLPEHPLRVAPAMPPCSDPEGPGMDADTLLFTGASSRTDLVAAYPELDEVCDSLSFGWGHTLAEWCNDPEWALLELARSALPPSTPPILDWSTATVPALIRDIVETHHKPMRHEISRLRLLISQFFLRHPDADQVDIAREFPALVHDILVHAGHEEAIVFPADMAIDEARRRNGIRMPIAIDVASAIRFMSLGHDDVDQALRRMKALLDSLSAACIDPDLPLMIACIDRMQADLAIHGHKEDVILRPAVIVAEEQVRARSLRSSQAHFR